MTRRLRRILIAAVLTASLGNLTANMTVTAGEATKHSTVLVPLNVREVFARGNIKVLPGDAKDHNHKETKERFTFTVELPYDPQSSQTVDYFRHLYPDLLDALGGASYTLIDVTDSVRINVDLDKLRNKLSVEITQFK
jgi:hypothetical protein